MWYCRLKIAISLYYNRDRLQRALIARKTPMFYHCIKHRKNVFYWFFGTLSLYHEANAEA